jgi:hypothetical protein
VSPFWFGCPALSSRFPSRYVLITPCMLPTHFLGGTEEEGISIVRTEGHSELSISNRCSGIALSARLVRRAVGGLPESVQKHTPCHHHHTMVQLEFALQKRNTRSVDRSYFFEATFAEFICWQINQPMSCQFVCFKEKGQHTRNNECNKGITPPLRF